MGTTLLRRFGSLLVLLVLTTAASGQCGITVEAGAPFCAGESVSLGVDAGPAGTTYAWSVPGCPGCLQGANTATPVFTAPPPSDGTDFTVNLTVTEPGDTPCVATSVQIPMEVTPFANISVNGYSATAFNGLMVFADCTDPASVDFAVQDACQQCTGSALSLSMNAGAYSAVGTGWSQNVTVAGDMQTLTYVVNNGACPDTGFFGLFVGNTQAPPGSFTLDQGQVTTICSDGSLSFGLLPGLGVVGTTYTVYNGESTTPYGQYQYPPPNAIDFVYGSSSCGNSTPFITCPGGQACLASPVGSYSIACCITNPCAGICYTTSVTVLGAPSAFFTHQDPVCEDTNVLLDGTVTGTQANCAPANVQWSITPGTYTPVVLPNSADISVQFQEPGTYQVQMSVTTPACGDSVWTDVICVESPPDPSFSLVLASDCAPTNATVAFDTPNTEDCPDPMEFLWSVSAFGNNPCQDTGTFAISDPDGPVPGISFSGPGTYLVDLDVEDPGCPVQSAQQTVTVHGPPEPLAFTVDQDTICEGDPVVVSGTVQNCDQGSPAINWTIENGTPASFTGANPGPISFSGTTPGQPNTITVTATNGCPGTVSQDIDIWVVPASPPIDPQVDVLQICPGDPVEVTFTASPGVTYGWAITGTALSGSNVSSPFTITGTDGLLPDDYTIQITSDNAGCGAADASVNFQVQQAESLLIIGPEAVCEGAEVNLTVTGATNPQWNINGVQGGTGNSMTDVPAGTTTYAVTSAGVPGSCPGQAELVVSTIAYPVPGFDLPGTPCAGSPATLDNTTAGAFDWEWLVDGNGVPNNTVEDLVYTFPSTDPFTVSLIASTQTSPACPDTATMTITPVEGPSVAITTLDAATCGSTISVDLQADATGNNLAFNWQWSGGSAGIEDPGDQVFTMNGGVLTTYTVSVGVTSSGSTCAEVTDQITVTLYPEPVAGLVVGPAPCVGQPYVFTSSSIGADVIGWTVDGTVQPTGPDLTHTFATGGPHTVGIFASTNTVPACIDSSDLVVQVAEQPTVDLPLTAIDTCAAELLLDFAPVFSGTDPSFSWDFGTSADPDNIISPAPTNVLFPGDAFAPITYPVVVSVSVPNSVCPSVSDATTVTLLPFPIAIVNADQNTYCEGAEALFTQVGEGIIDSCQWVFSDDPADTITTVFPLIQTAHLFPLVDVPTQFVVTCLVYNPCGVATDVDTVTIVPSNITIATNTDPLIGCAPLTVTFQNNTASDTSAAWYLPLPFGMVVADTVVVTFDQPGVYQVIARSYACGFDEDTITVTVLEAPVPVMNAAPDPFCSGTPITFTSTAPGTNVLGWLFGDGDSSALAQPSHLFDGPGNYMVTLEVGWALNQCTGSITTPVPVSASPTGGFTFGPPICAPDTVCFDATAQSTDSYTWDFGNSSTEEDPCDLFTAPGVFPVSLLLANADGCTLLLDTVLVVDTLPQAVFSALVLDPCHSPAPVTFANNSTHATGYLWDFGTLGASTATTPALSIPQPGSWPVQLTVSGTPGIPACIAVVDTTLVVHPEPLAVAQVLTDPACTMRPVQFDANGSQNGLPVWSLGDGNTAEGMMLTHVYDSTGSYVIQLMITGAGGCTDTLDVPLMLVVHPSPTAAFTFHAEESLPELIHFTNTSIGATVLEWNFGDAGISGEEHPQHRYDLRSDGCEWPVRLSVMNAEGCADTTYRTVHAEISVVHFIANAFTPNGAGPVINERFRPDFVVDMDVVARCDYRFTIFDRWGHKLFETTDPYAEWDGLFPDGSAVPQGAYVWAVHMVHPCIPPSIRDREGHVNLVR